MDPRHGRYLWYHDVRCIVNLPVAVKSASNDGLMDSSRPRQPSCPFPIPLLDLYSPGHWNLVWCARYRSCRSLLRLLRFSRVSSVLEAYSSEGIRHRQTCTPNNQLAIAGELSPTPPGGTEYNV